MKISFDDKSYLEIKKSDKPGMVIVIISAKDFENDLKKITNSVEITEQQFKDIFLSLG